VGPGLPAFRFYAAPENAAGKHCEMAVRVRAALALLALVAAAMHRVEADDAPVRFALSTVSSVPDPLLPDSGCRPFDTAT
jgi:hypothetical protein